MGLHHGRNGEWTLTPEESQHWDELARKQQESEAKRPQRFECECRFCNEPFQSLERDSTECPSCFEGFGEGDEDVAWLPE